MILVVWEDHTGSIHANPANPRQLRKDRRGGGAALIYAQEGGPHAAFLEHVPKKHHDALRRGHKVRIRMDEERVCALAGIDY